MVASDTVVGLVGAAILVVALVGVFVIENQETGASHELALTDFHGEASGAVHALGARGSPPAPLTCAQAPTCAGPITYLNITIENVPVVEPGISYVAFLTQTSGPAKNMGALAPQGARYTLQAVKPNEDNRAYKAVVVSVETNKAATAPGNITAFTQSVNLEGGNSVAITGEAHVRVPVAMDADASVATTDADNGRQATVTATKLVNISGFTYRAWAFDNGTDGPTYKFVGNLSDPDGDDTWTTSGVIAKLEYEEYQITLERTGYTTNGQKWGGILVFREVATSGSDDHVK